MKYILKTIILLTVSLIPFNSESQTKQQCISQLKLLERDKEEFGWLATEITGTIFKTSNRVTWLNTEWTSEILIDMRKVEAVIVKYDETLHSWYPYILLTGQYCIGTNIQDDGKRETYSLASHQYYHFKEKKDAIRIQKILIQLAKLCGAKLISNG